MVKINVTEQSKYPPVVSPLEVFITTVPKVSFSARVIGKLHASDQDPHDILTFQLMSESPPGTEGTPRFSVDPSDGRVVAEDDLAPGTYALNVSVSDGTSVASAPVRVHVWAASQRLLDRGFGLRLAGLSPEDFLGDHWRGLQRSLSAALGLPRHELHIASLQQEPNSLVLDVLLLWRPQGGAGGKEGGGGRVLTQRLAGAVANAEEALGLSVLRLRHDGCLEPGCPPRGCQSSVLMSEERVSHYTTDRMGFITPQHRWESVCSCNGMSLSPTIYLFDCLFVLLSSDSLVVLHLPLDASQFHWSSEKKHLSLTTLQSTCLLIYMSVCPSVCLSIPLSSDCLSSICLSML